MRIPKKSHAGVLMKMKGNQYLGEDSSAGTLTAGLRGPQRSGRIAGKGFLVDIHLRQPAFPRISMYGGRGYFLKFSKNSTEINSRNP
jgi:hypothetical protein